MKNLQVRFLQTQKQDFFAFCVTCCNIFICRNLHMFWSAFCEFCWCFCCKVMQYRACQWVTCVWECFLRALLVFLLQSDAISCMSISYACLGVLFVSFACLLAEMCCNIVHVNKLRVFLVMRCIKLWCFVFKSTLLIYIWEEMRRKW